MTANGTSLTSRDVRLESAKRGNADIDQIAVANCDFMSTRPCGLHRPRGVLCQIVTGGQIPFGFLGQNYFGVTRIHREGTRPVHRPGGLPPPEGSALGGQNIPILNVSTYNSDSSSIHRTLRTSRCVLPSFQHSLPLDIFQRFLIFWNGDHYISDP